MFLQEATQAIDPMNPDFLPAQFTLSTFMVWLIDLLKRSNWVPWISKDTQKLNTVLGILAAAATAAGIHFVMENTATGTYVITLSGITLEGIWHFMKGFAIAIASQQTILKVYQITNTLREISGKVEAPKT